MARRYRRDNPDTGTALLLLAGLAAAGGAGWYWLSKRQEGQPDAGTCPGVQCGPGTQLNPITCQCDPVETTGGCAPGFQRSAEGKCVKDLGPVDIIFR